jgi:acetyltransferase
MARAVAAVARRATKPVLGAWLGAVDRREATAALEAGGIPNFYTPEHAVEAFSFLAAYRHHQEWLLEVPPSQPEPRPPDLAVVERIRAAAASTNRRALTEMEVHALLSQFGLPVATAESADTLAEALAAARRMGFPVTLRSDTGESVTRLPLPAPRERLRDGRMLTRTWAAIIGAPGNPHRRLPVIVAKEQMFAGCENAAIGICTDALFGPVITFGPECAGGGADVVVLLPPLNLRLARDAIRGTGMLMALPDADAADAATEALARILVQVSALACAVPWVRTLALYPVRVDAGHAEIAGARVMIDARAKPTARSYGHMAIHPYPVEMVADVALDDGRHLRLRPIRPEDAEMERAFVSGLSEESRFFRFFYRLHELTPAMLARFTQIDYDRELALVAVDEAGAVPAIVGVARYVMSLDQEAAEFAVVVADAWHGKGVGRNLMARLVAYAKARGLRRLEGRVLRGNSKMLAFIAALGFKSRDSAEDPEQLSVVLELQ